MEYTSPTVKCLNQNFDVWYWLWMSSRRFIIRSDDKLIDWNYIFSHPIKAEEFPEEFYIGNELVKNKDYIERVKKLNLQFMNFGEYILEIQGSCLFRDLLFNMNKIGQWAESNRFKFSILPPESIFEENSYPVSKEYQDIEEWDDQFDAYMEAIKKDQITDHNRLEMPYSISSKFWVSITRREAIAFISMIKSKMPFFYLVYGQPMMTAIGITENELNPWVDDTLAQYFNPDHHKDGMAREFNGIVQTQLDMGLILYSQFLRQSDCIISGLYSELVHTNPVEFSHKVFKGNSILHVTYTAHHNRVLRTISNRCCNFAQSSGDGPCSWSKFINIYLSNIVKTTDDFRNLLPCKFAGKRVSECKFHDDVKFRKEGIESKNTICPLIDGDQELAKIKLQRDNNQLAIWYWRLVEEMQNE